MKIKLGKHTEIGVEFYNSYYGFAVLFFIISMAAFLFGNNEIGGDAITTTIFLLIGGRLCEIEKKIGLDK